MALGALGALMVIGSVTINPSDLRKAVYRIEAVIQQHQELWKGPVATALGVRNGTPYLRHSAPQTCSIVLSQGAGDGRNN
jgi:hypothetical protein